MGPPPQHHSCSACGRRLDKCKGRSRTLAHNSTPTTTVVYKEVCERCYKRHHRSDKHETPSIDLLLRAAVDRDVPPTSPSPSPPGSQSVVAPGLHPLSSSSCPLPLTNITNTPLKQRRHSTPLKRKRELVEAVNALSSPQQRAQFYATEGVDRHTMRRYAATVRENEQGFTSKQLRQSEREAGDERAKKRRPMTAKRLSGGGRKPVLTVEQERWLRDWVLSLRRCDHHFAVAEIHIQLAARSKFGINVGDKWVQGFMKRHNFSMRIRTTNKEVTTQPMQDIRFHWRNKFAPIFAQRHPYLLFNMDETSMYLDAPSNRTVDEVGAKVVEIGTTHHYKSRLAVLLCVDLQGRMLTPLVVYRCYEKVRLVKTHQFFKKTIITSDGKPFEIIVTYAKKAWLNGAIMEKWLQEVYHPHLQTTGLDIKKSILFMDNCSAHRTDEAMAFFQQTGVGYQFFPPHCTPILQPLDQTVNREFKREYEREWSKWFQETGCLGRTPMGNRKAATEDEVNVWVASALSRITPHMVRVSWRNSTCSPPHLMHMQETCWRKALSYLPASQLIPLLPLLDHHRKYYTGQHFRFPVAERERVREEEEDEKKERKEEEEEEEDEIEEEGESGDKQWQIVQEVPLSSLYTIESLPPGVTTGRLRLHPQALLIVK